jgi:acetone carboxylase gamma subunit
MKAFYNRESATFMTEHKCKKISMYSISELSGKAYPKAVTPASITSGFHCIDTFNLMIFKDHEFFNSYVSERQSTLNHSDQLLLLTRMLLISQQTMRTIPNPSQDSLYMEKLKNVSLK